MSMQSNRRRFLAQMGAAAAGMALPTSRVLAVMAGPDKRKSRVVITRDVALTHGRPAEHREP